MQNVVGPTLVAMATNAMATKLGPGAEIQSPTGLFKILSVYVAGIMTKTTSGLPDGAVGKPNELCMLCNYL